MSLIKSFNFNFLKQNLKKSKGGIILSLIIVPLLMSIFLVVMGINNSSPEFISPEMFGIINMIFSSFSSSVGNLNATADKKKRYDVFKVISF